MWTGKHSPGFFVLKSELLLCKIKIPCEKEIAVPLLFYKEEKCRHLLQNIGRVYAREDILSKIFSNKFVS